MVNVHGVFAIQVKELTKVYKLYSRPIDRLKESLNPFGKKYHEGFFALQDLSFCVEKGSTVGIIGKNGSGKSTLLKIVTGVLTQSSGIVKVNGKVSALLELGAGFNPELTGLENVYMNAGIMGFSKQDIDEKLKDIISFADIGDFIHQPVKLYSSGMFARLAFALAINVEPEILIVDEALAVGDVRFQIKCFNRLKEMKQRGITILFVSHDVYAVRNLCDKALWINEGKLMAYGDTVEVTAKYMEYMNGFNKPSEVSLPTEDDNVIKSDMLTGKLMLEPINRWGSKEGLIKSVIVTDSTDSHVDTIQVGESFKVKVCFYVPEDIDTDFLSAAISIKNAVGLDLLVSTTFDDGNAKICRVGCNVEVTFNLNNYLNQGEYILVAALEDRSQATPEYYDYIEGAYYFRVFSKKQLFGLFNQPVLQEVRYIGERMNG